MKKRIFTILVTVAVLFTGLVALTGCGEKTDENKIEVKLCDQPRRKQAENGIDGNRERRRFQGEKQRLHRVFIGNRFGVDRPSLLQGLNDNCDQRQDQHEENKQKADADQYPFYDL